MCLQHDLQQGPQFECDLHNQLLGRHCKFTIFKVPSCSAFSSSRMRLSIFSSGSREWPQLATGIQVLGLPGCHCKSKAAMPWLDTLVSIHSSAIRSALSQCSAVTTCCTILWTHSPADFAHCWVSWPKSWRKGLTNSAKARTYSL